MCDAARAFAVASRRGSEVPPDYTAAYTYDAVRLLVTAVRCAGLNRVAIRDAARALSPWDGVTGRLEWDPTGRNRWPSGGRFASFSLGATRQTTTR